MRIDALKKLAAEFDLLSDVPADVQKMDKDSYPMPMPGNWLSALVGADPKDWKFEEWKSFPGYARTALPTIDVKALKQKALDSLSPTNTEFRAWAATNAFPKVNRTFLNRHLDATYDAVDHIKDDKIGIFSAGRVFDKFKKKYHSSMQASEPQKGIQKVKSSQALTAPNLRKKSPTLVGGTNGRRISSANLRGTSPTLFGGMPGKRLAPANLRRPSTTQKMPIRNVTTPVATPET